MTVQAAICKCGSPIKLAVFEDKPDRATTREFAKLMEQGYSLQTITLEKARSGDMCFGECGQMQPLNFSI